MSVRSAPSMSLYTHLDACRHWTKKCSGIFLWSMPGWLMQSVAVQFPLRDVTEWPNAPIDGIPNILYHRYVWGQSRLIHGWNTLQGFLCYDRSMSSGIILLDSVSDGTQEGYDNRVDHSVYILANSNCVVSNYQRRYALSYFVALQTIMEGLCNALKSHQVVPVPQHTGGHVTENHFIQERIGSHH